ncbi:hypothetical protein [Aquimarina algiphila]|uniref:hypothetical protein n=1 Tax=Aquimarina algiphila TaxID=2047982 RepID=UPI002490571A|nr:hypothetical protein [Aquimarina algiphila]
MKVTNIHKRTIHQPKSVIVKILETLSTTNDQIWPYEKWPAMRFKEGLREGAKGGHGPIKYTIEKYEPGKLIQFKFSKPTGLNGIHKLEIFESGDNKTRLVHTIAMNAVGKGLLLWIFIIRSFHNALIEDAFDKVENHFLDEKKITKWNIWVRIWRKILG